MSDILKKENAKKTSPSQKRKSRRRRGDGKTGSAYRTISEVADELDVAQHVLRFWETKFNEVEPLKRGGGRRYYRPEDVVILKKIHNLLYTQGFTIKGVQNLLKKDKSLSSVSYNTPAGMVVEHSHNGSAPSAQPSDNDGDGKSLPPEIRTALSGLLQELKTLRSLVE